MTHPRKTVLITGCTDGGIGGGLAEFFHEKGYHVYATLRDPSKIPSSLSASPNATVLTLDVLSSDSITAAVETVRSTTGDRLDVLINNSGIGFSLPALDTPIEESKRVFDVNLWAPTAMFHAFAPLVVAAKGCIVNNTSVNGFVPMPLMSEYHATSFCGEGLTV